MMLSQKNWPQVTFFNFETETKRANDEKVDVRVD